MPNTLSDQLSRAIQKSKAQGVSDAAITAGINNFLNLYSQQINQRRDRELDKRRLDLQERALELQYGGMEDDWSQIESEAIGQDQAYQENQEQEEPLSLDLPYASEQGYSTATPKKLAEQLSPNFSDYLIQGEPTKEDLFKQPSINKNNQPEFNNSEVSIESISQAQPNNDSFWQRYISTPLVNLKNKIIPNNETRYKSTEEIKKALRK